MTTPFMPFYREIALDKGQFALVDEEDFEWLSQWKWKSLFDETTKRYYVYRSQCGNGTVINVRMHRVIMGLEKGDKRQVDHINLNSLDNRRSNLRIVTQAQNMWNRPKFSTYDNPYKGVTFRKDMRCWRFRVCVNGIRHSETGFSSAEEANEARMAFAKLAHGEHFRE